MMTVSRADDFDYGVAAFATVVCFDMDSLRACGVSACNEQVIDYINNEELMLDSMIPILENNFSSPSLRIYFLAKVRKEGHMTLSEKKIFMKNLIN